ncbi:MAG: hypothetical protein K2X97_17760 [Mycobacteriaceae bacterium]|nr:hypothetical protein [Mycobacteriaceae bacterium]
MLSRDADGNWITPRNPQANYLLQLRGYGGGVSARRERARDRWASRAFAPDLAARARHKIALLLGKRAILRLFGATVR